MVLYGPFHVCPAHDFVVHWARFMRYITASLDNAIGNTPMILRSTGPVSCGAHGFVVLSGPCHPFVVISAWQYFYGQWGLLNFHTCITHSPFFLLHSPATAVPAVFCLSDYYTCDHKATNSSEHNDIDNEGMKQTT